MENVIGKTLKLREDLTLVSIDDTTALLDVEKKRYFDPNETAAFLLKLMEDGCLHEKLRARLVSDFDVAQETAREDIGRFIQELLRLGLVDIKEATAQGVVDKPDKKRKPYRAPRLEHEANIDVACGPTVLSLGTEE